jgi:hypothetical protein
VSLVIPVWRITTKESDPWISLFYISTVTTMYFQSLESPSAINDRIKSYLLQNYLSLPFG